MYRQDPQRSGSTPVAVPETLKVAWKVSLASRGSQRVVVGDRLWIAEKDARRIPAREGIPRLPAFQGSERLARSATGNRCEQEQ